MTAKSKLILSDGELQLMCNTEWILTKRTIIDKVNTSFGTLAERMRYALLQQENNLGSAVISSSPKIAKGENYQQLPYVILDYPRQFEKHNFFAIRTMFWWGNFFSCTLHLSGSYKEKYQQALIKNISAIEDDNIYICVNSDEWQHHFEADNYISVGKLPIEAIQSIVLQQHFIKVAAKFPLHQWSEIDVLLEQSFATMLALLKY